jgi:hypothetical protein
MMHDGLEVSESCDDIGYSIKRTGAVSVAVVVAVLAAIVVHNVS